MIVLTGVGSAALLGGAALFLLGRHHGSRAERLRLEVEPAPGGGPSPSPRASDRSGRAGPRWAGPGPPRSTDRQVMGVFTGRTSTVPPPLLVAALGRLTGGREYLARRLQPACGSGTQSWLELCVRRQYDSVKERRISAALEETIHAAYAYDSR
jgi:hypothetical protein